MIEIALISRDQFILDTVAELGGSCEYRELLSRLPPKCMVPSTLTRRLSFLVKVKELVRFPAENEGTCRCEACRILRHDLKMPRDGLRRRRPIYFRVLPVDEFMRALEPWLSPLVEYLRAHRNLDAAHTS